MVKNKGDIYGQSFGDNDNFVNFAFLRLLMLVQHNFMAFNAFLSMYVRNHAFMGGGAFLHMKASC